MFFTILTHLRINAFTHRRLYALTHMGWKHKTSLKEGLRLTYQAFLRTIEVMMFEIKRSKKVTTITK
jgi:hypothetical protein